MPQNSLREGFTRGGLLERSLAAAQQEVSGQQGWVDLLNHSPANVNDLAPFLRVASMFEEKFVDNELLTAALAVTRGVVLLALKNQPEVNSHFAHEAALEAFEKLEVLWRVEQTEELGWIWDEAGKTWGQRLSGDRGLNVERSIACFEAAFTVRTRDRDRQGWASTLNNLGTAYLERSAGDRGANLEQAISLYQAALTEVTYETDRESWARIQSNLGNVYAARQSGDRAENLERSIACFNEALSSTLSNYAA